MAKKCKRFKTVYSPTLGKRVRRCADFTKGKAKKKATKKKSSGRKKTSSGKKRIKGNLCQLKRTGKFVACR